MGGCDPGLREHRVFKGKNRKQGVYALAVRNWVGVWGKAIFKIIGQAVGAKPQTADRVQQEHPDLAKFSVQPSDWLCLRCLLRFLLLKHIHGFVCLLELSTHTHTCRHQT